MDIYVTMLLTPHPFKFHNSICLISNPPQVLTMLIHLAVEKKPLRLHMSYTVNYHSNVVFPSLLTNLVFVSERRQ